MVSFSFVCLLKLILYNSQPQNQMCDWNQKCFCFNLQKPYFKLSTWLTHLTLRFLYILGGSGLLWGSRCDMRNAKCTRAAAESSPRIIRLLRVISLQWLDKDIKLVSWSCQEHPKKDSICYKNTINCLPCLPCLPILVNQGEFWCIKAREWY